MGSTHPQMQPVKTHQGMWRARLCLGIEGLQLVSMKDPCKQEDGKNLQYSVNIVLSFGNAS